MTRTRHSTEYAKSSTHLAVTPEGESVVPLPRLPPASSGVVVLVSLSKTTALLAGGGEATALAVLVDRLGDPVDAGITADGLVLGVDEDDFVVLVGRVLVDPVRVEDAEVSGAATDTLLSSGLERALVLELVHTLVGRLAIGGTLGDGPLATTTADADAIDNVALLGLVSQTTSLVGAGRTGGAVNNVKLAELLMHSQQSSTSNIN
jgi:hypothetical protein